MPIFQPVYRAQAPSSHNQSNTRKRKRSTALDSDDEGSLSPSAQPALQSQASSMLNKKDPYYIAGTSREDPLPAAPFPHAPLPSPGKAGSSTEEQLAALKPPLNLPKDDGDERSSAKRRHLDNVTTILHTSMLRGDWQRAAHAWSLLVRTEIGGKGVDVRAHGRWTIGGELLMRQAQSRARGYHQAPNRQSEIDNDDGSTATNAQAVTEPVFTDEGFQLAREYYQRLALQYPYTAQASRGILDARAVYPALFTIWIYEVQDRFKRAKDSPFRKRPYSSNNDSHTVANVRETELQEALPIAERMDELLLSPPHDTSAELLQIRGMVALWLSDLYDASAEVVVSGRRTSSGSESGSSERSLRPRPEERLQAEQHRKSAKDERRRATELLGKVVATGIDLPQEAQRFLEK